MVLLICDGLMCNYFISALYETQRVWRKDNKSIESRIKPSFPFSVKFEKTAIEMCKNALSRQSEYQNGEVAEVSEHRKDLYETEYRSLV